ncbi:MAG: MoaD/ThiS family protein [Eubacteriaceae bacterium]
MKAKNSNNKISLKIIFFSEIFLNKQVKNIEKNKKITIKLSFPYTIYHLIEEIEENFPSLAGIFKNNNGSYPEHLAIVINGKDFCHISNFNRILHNNDEITFMYLGVGG